VIRLYLDDAGSEKKDVAFAMGGYIATEKRWAQFERDWRGALDDADIDVFHATDFFSRRGRYNKKGDRYEDWPDHRHIKFAKRFTAIAESNTDAGVVRGVDVAAYSDLVLPESVFRVGTPHNRMVPRMFCVRTCLEWIARRWPDRPKKEPIVVILEEGPGVGEVIDWCIWLKRHTSWGAVYCTFTPAPKSSLPLQAADLVAHEGWRLLKETLAPTGRPPRRSLGRLLRRHGVDIGASTRAQLIAGIPEVIKFANEYHC